MVVLPEKTTTFPARLAEWIERERISVWYSVPSVLTMLATYGNLRGFDLSGLRAIIFAGEVFPVKHLTRLMAELPDARYLNWYGPTETNVCTWYEVPPGSAELTAPVPIGQGLRQHRRVRGHRRRRPGIGAGRGGRAVRAGARADARLLGRPGQDRPRCWSATRSRRPTTSSAYRTGDLVTLDEEGNYVFLGRRDGMVKTRGYRVELGEVEAALYAHPAIREAVVLPVPDELLGNRLRAVISAERLRRPDPRGGARALPCGGCPATWCRTWWSSARRCPGPPPARSTAPSSPGPGSGHRGGQSA